MLDKARRIIQAGFIFSTTMAAKGQLESITFCTKGYIEPGYDDPESGVIAFGNWDAVSVSDISSVVEDLVSQIIDDTPKRVANLLQKLGVQLENKNEWTTCNKCQRAFRTQANSHDWQFFGWDNGEGNVTCGECLYLDPAEYLAFLEAHHNRCLTIPCIDLSKYGYVMLEKGFVHPGDNDPRLIVKALQDQGIERFIFRLDSTGRFDCNFSVYLHESELPDFDVDAWLDAPKDVSLLSEEEHRALLADFESQNDARGILERGTTQLRLHSPDDLGDSTQDA